MFVMNVMWKTKLMTEKIQKEQLNILDALVILEVTITTLQTMSECEVEMNNNIRAATEVASKFDIDAQVEYGKFHRVHRSSKRKDDLPETSTIIDFRTFYRKEMKAVLNTLTTKLSDNYKTSLEKLKPVMVLFPPLKPVDNDARSAISELSKLCPGGLLDDIHGLETEFDIFVNSLSKDEAETMQTSQHVAGH